MASPWISPTPHRPPAERPWLGMALLAAVPLLLLILIRMLWSGSGLWFLTIGIILLGAAAVVFLARRTGEAPYSRPALAQEPDRLPVVLMGLGVLFLALLVLPSFAGGDSDSGPPVQLQERLPPPGGLTSQVSGVSQPPTQPTAVRQQRSQAAPQEAPAQEAAPEGSQVYLVQDGDTLWDIALRFDTTVEAIVEANGLENPEDIAIDQELIIPPPEENPATDEEAAPSADTLPPEGEATPQPGQ